MLQSHLALKSAIVPTNTLVNLARILLKVTIDGEMSPSKPPCLRSSLEEFFHVSAMTEAIAVTEKVANV